MEHLLFYFQYNSLYFSYYEYFLYYLNAVTNCIHLSRGMTSWERYLFFFVCLDMIHFMYLATVESIELLVVFSESAKYRTTYYFSKIENMCFLHLSPKQ